MICPKCGFDNLPEAKYCRNCGNSLNNNVNYGYNDSTQVYQTPQKNNNNLLIIGITVIVIALILAGTYLFISNNDNNMFSQENSDNSEVNINTPELKVSTVSFYLDGNPNTGIPATINVGKEHTGESMEVITTYSRDGTNLNNPSSYETHVVDEDGNIIITEYAPIPKYPDYCRIEIRYNNQVYKYGCDMGKYKGSQSSVPYNID